MNQHEPVTMPERYWKGSQFPLQALIFLLPLLVVYELALPYVISDGVQQVVSDVYARRLLYRFFEMLDVAAYHLPAVIVVVVLLCWHVARRDPWRIRPRLYVGMWCESLALAFPLCAFAILLQLSGALPDSADGLAATTQTAEDWKARMIFAIGAGIYEELLFRLIAISLLHMILIDVLALPKRPATLAVVGLSALAFGLYHFPTYNFLDWDAGQWGRLVFYTGAGVYFAVLFVVRGFGIVAGTHAMYDVLVVLLDMLQANGT